MNTFTKSAIAAVVFAASGAASANPMILDLSAFGGNLHDSVRLFGTADADSATASFSTLDFNGLLATSLYDISDGSLFGAFFDTNIETELTAAGVPASGTALDGVSSVSLTMPDCALGQCDLDGLSPLAPPLATNNEGFLQTWDLQVLYHFDGTLTASGPVYTGGTFDVFFNSLIDDSYDALAFSGNLVGSTINLADLELTFEITTAATGFLNIWNGSAFIDAATFNSEVYNPVLTLNTNVVPPIPTDDQLLVVGTNAIRQTTLNGQITGQIPEPSSIALFGLGLLGLGAASRRKA